MPVPSFSVGEVLTSSAMNQVGLWKIAETTFTNSATPFINGCFSSDYQNYVVKMVLTSAGSATNVFFRFRSGTSTPENGAVYDRYGCRWSTSAINMVSANLTNAHLIDVTSTTSHRGVVTMDIFSPNETIYTVINTHSWDSNTGEVWFPSYRMETTTAYTGLEISSYGGSNLTGSIRVYGYRN